MSGLLLFFYSRYSSMQSSAINIHHNAGGFVFAGGAILGVCAGLLWTAQGSLMLSYPTEIQKGRFISIFWTIYNLGAVIGSAVSLSLNFQSSVGIFWYFQKLYWRCLSRKIRVCCNFLRIFPSWHIFQSFQSATAPMYVAMKYRCLVLTPS